MADPVLQLVVSRPSPRLAYAADLIFDQLLGIPFTMTERAVDGLPTINYSSQALPGALRISNAGLTEASGCHPVDPTVHQDEGLPLLFYTQENPTDFDLPFDIFSATFFLATEYEKWVSPRFDRHARYDPPAYRHHREGWYAQPLVHLYAQRLRAALLRFFPQLKALPLPGSSFDFEITFDLDFPWKYRHKPLVVQAGGFVKDLIRGRFSSLRERTATLLTDRDPYFTFDQLFAHFPPEKTRFFFLIDRHSPHDSRFTWRLPALQQLIRDIRDRGYALGIHPSYNSFLDPAMIRAETEALRQLTGSDISASRQHFLRYRLPETFRTLIDLGIRDEYSLCAFHTGGFPTGMAAPYPWYDLEAERATDLMLHPTLLMDRSLEAYLRVAPGDVAAHFARWIEATKAVGGLFTLLLHNDCLSESGEWKGWREPVLSATQALLKAKN